MNGKKIKSLQAARIIPAVLSLIFVMCIISACSGKKANIAEIEKRYPQAIITPSGLRYVVVEQGTGPKAIVGRNVLVNYKGTLLNGHEFDNTDLQGRPLEFEVGIGNAIKGFDEAVLDMREGDKRIVIIPPELGYGDRRVGSVPGNSFLIFELELFRVK